MIPEPEQYKSVGVFNAPAMIKKERGVTMPIEIIAVAIIVFCIVRAIVKKIKEIRKSHYRDVTVHMPYEALRSRRAYKKWRKATMHSLKL